MPIEMFLLQIAYLLSSRSGIQRSSAGCFPSLFAFGDSKTDTGNKQAYFPYESRSERLPYGSTFFGRPSDRFCDGRLTIDFQGQAYGLPLLSPYARGLGFNFQHGANFAISGSGCFLAIAPNNMCLPLTLPLWKLTVFPYTNCITNEECVWLYVISIGENDYRNGILNMGLTSKEIKSEMAPKVVNITYSTVKALYNEGTRKFLVVGIAADGCIPKLLTLVSHEDPEGLDELGCLVSMNDYVQYHNILLFKAVKRLRTELSDAQISFGDFFGANVDIFVNAHKYGEVDGTEVTTSSCDNPYEYINWDGIHLTACFYEFIALAFLHGYFVDEPLILPSSCSRNFSSFTSGFLFLYSS
ncbi:hypothetical protein KP509_16G018900 [Ceratopteris richardii]|uniref:GDSL esterase/lipase n=1 Tax=Ceratopteris richardii TaxID=49495 RepID=A0A8T2T027_CERRI|nr:hypothetical protein KP509_16G018900 [Ceratopteris richardii]